MTEAGRAAEVVEDLKMAIEKAQTPEEIEAAAASFPRGGIFSIFQIAPELLPESEPFYLGCLRRLFQFSD